MRRRFLFGSRLFVQYKSISKKMSDASLLLMSSKISQLQSQRSRQNFFIMIRSASIIEFSAVLILSSFTNFSLANDFRKNIGSAAQLWKQRTTESKQGYLQGVCEGLQYMPGSDIGDSFCESADQIQKKIDLRRDLAYKFCMAVYDRQRGIKYFDHFYSQAKHSDVPSWAAVASFNDKACGTDTVSKQIPKIQASGKCHREMANMAGMEKEVFAAKQAVCDRYRREAGFQ